MPHSLQLQASFKSTMKILDIGEVARLAGIAPSALRHYEQKGLIRAIGRNGLRRQYKEEVLDRLRFIALGRAAGFTLDNIAAMFTAQGNIAPDRDALAAKAQELDEVIEQLQRTRDGLRHMANCPAQTHMACPEFQKILHRGTF